MLGVFISRKGAKTLRFWANDGLNAQGLCAGFNTVGGLDFDNTFQVQLHAVLMRGYCFWVLKCGSQAAVI